jgi:3-methyladenine DNA glycosylase AlkD
MRERLNALQGELKINADKNQAKILQGFFKTGGGEYGEGDVFLGIKVPLQRKICKKYLDIDFDEIQSLLDSKIHEERFCASIILVMQFEKGDDSRKKSIFNFYIKNAQRFNNWDLVDLSAPKIVGEYLVNRDRKILYQLAKSKNLWERRIAILSTFTFIRENDFKDTLEISRILLNDEHNLIHKAVGWMLREVGKRDIESEKEFLNAYHQEMPRVMLRYALEKLSQKEKMFYMDKQTKCFKK